MHAWLRFGAASLRRRTDEASTPSSGAAFQQLSIWARDLQKAAQLAVKLSKVLTTVEFAVEPDIQRALATGDVILTTTPSRDPIVFGAWLRPGQHVTAVGADDPTKCEVDAEGLRRARVYVDAVETAVANGEVARAISQGLYASGALAGELGDVLAGRIRARIEDEEITIATLAGIGAQDLAAAEVVMAKLEALRVAA